MSDRDVRLYVEDMLTFCERAMTYAAEFDLNALLRDQMRYDAVLRNRELIGEAATHVGTQERALGHDIPWREVIGTRNRVAHAYLGISSATVWDIVTVELPALRTARQGPLKRLPAAVG